MLRARPVNQTLWLILCLVAWLAVAPGTARAAPFADLAGHWASDVITEMHAMELVEGDGQGRVRPNDPITREEFVALLLRAQDIAPDRGTTPFFADVDPTGWSYPYIQQARTMGLVRGVDATHFEPRAWVTREQMVAMVVRAGTARSDTRSGDPNFRDVAPDRWSAPYVLAAWRAGVVNGVAPDLFAPTRPATRAEAFVVVRRLLDAETKEAFLPDPAAVAQVVYDFEQALVASINEGPPYRWTTPYRYLLGAAREMLGETEQAYRNAADAGARVHILTHQLEARVTKLARCIATVEATKKQNVSLEGPGLDPSTVSRTRFYVYHLRLVNGEWRIYGLGSSEV